MLRINTLRGDDSSVGYREIADFQVRAFSDQNAPLGLQRVQTEDYYRWKYQPPMASAIIVSARENGKLISHIAAVPTLLESGHRNIYGWQLCDLATDINHRGRGLFTNCLQELLYALPGDATVFCVPNKTSLPILLKRGFLIVGSFRVWARPIILPSNANPSIILCSHVGQDADRNLGPVFKTRRDLQFMNWRFNKCPCETYGEIRLPQTHSSVIVKQLIIGGHKTTVVMAINAVDKSSERAMLHSVIQFSKENGHRAVLYLSSNWHWTIWNPLLPVPKWLMPRRLPIVSRTATHTLPLSLEAADWDAI